MSAVTITLGYLYPDMMSTYGDRGNVETVRRRCEWRGIGVAITELRLGDRMPADLDFIMLGGGGESQQRLVAADLYKVKGPAIRDAVAAGAAALAVGGGYELFGRFCQPENGAEYPGVDLFDAWTIRQRAVPGTHASLSDVRADRHIGELVARWGSRLLAGFENHSGGTYLGPAAQPLGRVLAGHGNNGDGTEGVILGAAVGTNLRGPCLPKNPVLADYLIGAAVARRHAGAELHSLPDELEQAARDVALQRAREAAVGTRRQVTRLLPSPGRSHARPAPLRLTQQRPVTPRSAPTGRR